IVANSVDDPPSDAISEPNSLSSANLPFTTTFHKLVPKPQVLSVSATPVFTDTSDNTRVAPKLTADITSAGPIDSFWPITSSLGLPASGYALVDNEIVFYASTGPALLVNVTRAQMGTSVVNHVSDAVLGFGVNQGDKFKNALRLVLSASDFEIQWNGLKLKRTRPDPLNGVDADVSLVRVFKDVNGDGTLNLDASGNPVGDVQVGTGTFGGAFSSVNINDGGIGYALIKKTVGPTTFFVTLDIDPTASFSDPQAPNLNEVVGVEVEGNSPASFILGPAGVLHTASILNQASSPNYVILPTRDTLQISISNLATGSVTQNDKNVAMFKLELNTLPGQNTAKLSSIKFNLAGTGVDPDISGIRVWRDGNNNQNFDVFDTTSPSPGFFPYLVSAGNDFFNNGESVVNFNPPLVIGTSTARFFVAIDIAERAQIGKTIGLTVTSTTSISVVFPDLKQSVGSLPALTALNTIVEAASVVRMGVFDMKPIVLSVSQSQVQVPFLRFNMVTDTSDAVWKSLLVEKMGIGAGGNQAKNKDVKFIRIFRDINTNDALDPSDVPVSGQKVAITTSIPSSMLEPFDLTVVSTQGFPASGNILVGDVELMEYSSILVSTSGFRITKRGMLLGDANTPRLSFSSGTIAEKVDFFDQALDNSRTRLVELTQPQGITRAAQTYFLAFDIGDAAQVGATIGAKVAGPSSIVIVAPPDTVHPKVFVGITQLPSNPDGDSEQDLPYETTPMPVNGTKLFVSGLSLAPSGVKPGTSDVPFLKLDFQTDTSIVDIGALKFTQKGSIENGSMCADQGRCDLVQVSLYLEQDNNGIFTPSGDKLIGRVTQRLQSNLVPSGTPDFDLGLALVKINIDGLPRLRVTTSPLTVYVVGTIGSSSSTVLGNQVGLSLASFQDIKGLGGAVNISAIEDSVRRPPHNSNQASIIPEIIPSVNLIPTITIASDGYPAYAVKDASGVVTRDGQGRPIPELSAWTSGNPQGRITVNGEPLIDVDGDGNPDNYDFNGDAKKQELDLDGDGLPDMDLDGDGLLDVDYNDDGIPDTAEMSGGVPQVFIRKLDGTKVPIPDNGFAKTAWAARIDQVYGSWAKTNNVAEYLTALGVNFNSVQNMSGWSTAGLTNNKTITGVSLPVSKVARLEEDFNLTDTQIHLVDASEFNTNETLYIGSEIVQAVKGTGGSCPTNKCFVVATRAVGGSTAQNHFKNEPVTNQAFLYSVRAQLTTGGIVPSINGRPILMIRPDPTPPTVPSVPRPLGGGSGNSYTLQWDPSADTESKVLLYEIQERQDTNPVWKTIALIPARRNGDAANTSLIISGKPAGSFFTYRTRAYNAAGVVSAWSTESAAAGVGAVSSEVISQVSNYPNPVDSRKGGPEGQAVITYVLNSDAEVKITLYDLLGYVVREYTFTSGSQGGRKGPNFVTWDGKNGLGSIVSKGGYIARIQVQAPTGS
ncbi:MAG: hypothetical protein HY399_04255, partial [Elusimicrobia bacterium]|nr:hypothetical protein [Elusimicrobiota bacterium]